MVDVTPDPRPLGRVKASRSEWAAIRASYGPETRCVACPNRYESLHHIVSRARGGDDLPVNLAPLCGDGTRGCHGEFESHGPKFTEVAGAIREYVCNDHERWLYAFSKLGERVFDKTYPHPRKFYPCPHMGCLLQQGHGGSHRTLSDEEFQPRRKGAA